MAVSTGRTLVERDNLINTLRNENIVLVYDTETTGVNVQNDRIVQLAVRACIVTTDVIAEVGSKTWYINPGFPMPEKAQQVHGLSDDFLKDMPSEKEVFGEIHDYFGDYAVCGYNNNAFDNRLMNAMYKRYGFEFKPRASIDVYPPVMTVIDASQIINHKLGTVAKYWGFDKEVERFHNAEGDTLATELILGKLMEVFSKELEPKYAGKLKVDVSEVAYWAGAGNVMPRIYVTGKVGTENIKFWVNPYTGSYQTADKKGDVNAYDIDDLEKKVLSVIRDYKSFKGKAIVGQTA